MNIDESIAEKYLKSLKAGSVTFEPDGNLPPDFKLRDSIGIEVRRLNENFFGQDKVEGLEQLNFTVHKALHSVLSDFDQNYNGVTYWVSLLFFRPFEGRKKIIEADLKRTLDEFLNGSRKVPSNFIVNDNIHIGIHSSSPIANRVFRHALSIDEDNGGNVIQGYINNISHCIADKKSKVKPYLSRYDEWWLLLIDNIGWSLTDEEIIEIKSAIKLSDSFSKLIVINQFGNQCLFELN